MKLNPERSIALQRNCENPLSRKYLLTMAHYLHVPEHSQRTIIWDAINTGNQNPQVIHDTLDTAIFATTQRLEGIGFTLNEYFQSLNAFNSNNTRLLKRLAHKADVAIREHLASIETTSQRHSYVDAQGKRQYSLERSIFHETIVQGALAEKQPVGKTLYVFIAPPGAGKSVVRETYIRDPANLVYTDPDIIRPFLVDNFNPQSNAQVQATHTESHDISDLILDRAMRKELSIVYEGSGSNYEGYKRDIKMCTDKGYKVELIFVANNLGESFRRAIVYRRDRGIALSVLLNSAKGFNNFQKLLQDPDISASIKCAAIIDNSGLHEKPRTIFSASNGEAVINDKKAIREWERYFGMFTNSLRRGRS